MNIPMIAAIIYGAVTGWLIARLHGQRNEARTERDTVIGEREAARKVASAMAAKLMLAMGLGSVACPCDDCTARRESQAAMDEGRMN